MNPALRPLFVAATAAAWACSSDAPPPSSGGDAIAGFQTSELHYDFRRTPVGIESRIPYTYRNTTGDSVYFIHCNRVIAPALEKRTGDTWATAWFQATPACLSPPIVVAPGGEFVDTVHVISGSSTYPQLDVADLEGTYRLVWNGVVHSYREGAPQFGVPLPQEARTSNPFTLSPPPR